MNLNSLPKTRKEAVATGSKYYFSGEPCNHGHICERLTKNWTCLECQRNINKKSTSKWRKDNREAINTQRRSYHKEKMMNCEAYRERVRLRNVIYDFNRRLKDYCNDKFIKPDYKVEQFVEHIESQFKEGMSWSNHGDWHIDHIKPIKVFLNEGVYDPRIINALSNLQPLWKSENLSKGANYEP